jgi:hypothetical protein
VWDIIEELILSTVQPPPKNPFKVDTHKLMSLPQLEGTLAAGALANFLRRLYKQGARYSEEGKLFRPMMKLMMRLSDLHEVRTLEN